MTTILLVEDDPLFRRELLEHLTNKGYLVDTAGGSKAAMRMLSETAYDVILTDIIMAEGEGIEFIIALRRTQPETPIIAMSAKKQYLQMAMNMGASHALVKPFRIAELERGLKRATSA